MTSKTLPFDLERAQSGVAVCLADGTPVEIVNFRLGISSSIYPILGRYKDRANEDVYEVWPASGTYADVIGGPEFPPQDLCLVAETSKLEAYGASLLEDKLEQAIGKIAQQEGELADLRREYRAALVEADKMRIELADWRKNYDKLVARVKDYASPEAFKRAQDELAAMRENYGQACLRIKELDAVVDKRIRLETWQKETLEVLKDWRQVEDFVNAEDGRADHEDGLEAWAVVLSRLKTLRDLTAMLKKL